ADKAVFDLWHWKDARLQPQQRVEASRDRERAHLAVYHLRDGRAVVLGDDALERVTLSDDGSVAIATSDLPYAVQSMWGDGATDLYVIDARTGQRTLVAEGLDFGVTSLSPGGAWVAFFDRGQWHAYDVARGERRDLTGASEVSFDRETWDTPSTPAPWGAAGWTQGDRGFLVYDRYDVWELDPTGRRAPRVVTDSLGRRQKLELRVVDLDPDEEAIDPRQPLLLAALDEETKQSGFWRDRLDGSGAPLPVIMEAVRFGRPSKAEGADRLLWTRSTVSDFPDVWVSDMDFRAARKLSAANPQQDEYLWPSVELVSWLSADGIPLKGLLYKPEGFDPSKKYPMAVYFYEQISDNLHAYNMATPRNLIHPTLYASQGYLVFEPDIAYQHGYPGPSAYKAIVPGVQSLIARGFVDADAVGIGGQSWGGYQTAWIITQTNLFAAAMAGAPVANMTSAYGGIRWGSGRARAFQYEVGQSRIGGSLWEHPWRYIENSPLFAADRIETPLLMMHNDNDGAVPWYQGIELFVAMRRLGKEVYLFNYNGDEHNPVKRANQLDIAMRMLQFFDHHLKGEPAPAWLEEGIPFLEKGRDQLRVKVAEEVTTANGNGGAGAGNR
ncbi:MAG TPA: prolyl oligopeptidase family serine peptidase, partial [Longimicrobiales bacterium]|nr:prolyl oligopeptidase family serine peptidase [Longimicrobiales bacterium]